MASPAEFLAHPANNLVREFMGEHTRGIISHIQITSYDNGNNYERLSIVLSDTLFAHLKDHPEITHVQDFITKPGIIKTEEDFMGVILKGVSKNYDWSFFQKNLVAGTLLQPNDTFSL